MSICTRIEDAQYLWSADRLEGAFVLVPIAAAATARRMFPNEKSDRKAFEDFLDATKSGKVTFCGHPSDEVAPKTLISILKQAGLR